MSRFDMGAAYEALAFDYSVYPLEQRKQKLLDHLERCIEPDPAGPPPRRLTTRLAVVLYTVMAVWLVVASIIRLVLFVAHGIPVDALPFLSLALGNFAIVSYLRTIPRPKEHS